MLTPAMRHWITDSVGSGSAIQSVSQLTGSTSTTLYRVEVARNGKTHDLVVRLFDNVEWLAEEPELARHEAANLTKIAQADTPTPELIAYDETGEACGIPALLMTALPGDVDLLPGDFDDWLHRLAAAILPIHTLDVGDHPWRYKPYIDVTTLSVPEWTICPDLWAKAIDIVNGPWPDFVERFIHRDYHPNNVLWQNGHVTGIVDWPNGCRGPAGIDAAWCRGNLSALYGVEAADRFLDSFQTLAGDTFDYHPFWDLMVIIERLPGPTDVYTGWIEHGITHLTVAILRERLDDWLTSIMARW